MLAQVDILMQIQLCIVSFLKSGFSTDGEFNSLRTNGSARPISVIEIIKNDKVEARKTKATVVSRIFQFNNLSMFQ